MGLDQYAYTRTADQTFSDVDIPYIWRKHSKLQEWAETLFCERTGQCAEKLNCCELELTLPDIEDLEALVTNKSLPDSEGGFFFGHQFQDEVAEESRAYDLEFCAWAKDAITNNQRVYYSCWW